MTYSPENHFQIMANSSWVEPYPGTHTSYLQLILIKQAQAMTLFYLFKPTTTL